jgi:hypothetical protein
MPSYLASAISQANVIPLVQAQRGQWHTDWEKPHHKQGDRDRLGEQGANPTATILCHWGPQGGDCWLTPRPPCLRNTLVGGFINCGQTAPKQKWWEGGSFRVEELLTISPAARAGKSEKLNPTE